MANCNHDCGSCSASCGERQDPASFKKPAHKESHIKKVIGVVSGKGGVGKSMVTSLLAMALRRAGKQVAILDADVTGPSIPKTFGLHGQALMTDRGVFPMETRMGIKVMSINLLLQNETDPVVWRGPIIAGAIQQFWTDVIYGDVDFLLVDMPPGTGDVPLTVFQTMPVDGIIVVASPQELVPCCPSWKISAISNARTAAKNIPSSAKADWLKLQQRMASSVRISCRWIRFWQRR